MVHESMKNLEFDRRLHGRRGWISEGEFESHLAELPDVASKGEAVAEADDSTRAPAETPEPPAGA